MKKRGAGLGVATLLVAGTLGLAGPASAADSWSMPNVEGSVLQEAHDAILSATDGAVVPVTSDADGMPYEQINLTNWVVCSQSPSAGGEISVQAPPQLLVARPNGCG
jgi:hypothetical protein